VREDHCIRLPTTIRSNQVEEGWPDHLTTPSNAGWACWRDGVLRSAGFPAAALASLADAECSELADSLDDALTNREECLHESIVNLGARIDALRCKLQGDDAGADSLKTLQRAIRALRGSLSSADVRAALPPDLLSRLEQANEICVVRGQAYSGGLERARMRFSALAAAHAADPAFREAVSWQNHMAVSAALDPLAQAAPMSSSRRRQRETLVANYLQRYSLKNDTIGFFGPMTWMRIVPESAGAAIVHGPDLVRRRTVRFEDWAIRTLAADIARDDVVLPWLVPRRHPFLAVEGSNLRLPGGFRMAVGEAKACVLAACDGIKTSRDVARQLLANPFGPISTEEQVLGLLRELEREDRIYLGFHVSSCDPRPEKALRQHLGRIDDDVLRDRALQRLARLDSAREAVSAAAGDATRLVAAMQALDEVFQAETGTAARRNGGEAYGGRALVYEDCHRDLCMSISETALVPLRDALDFVLSSARWFVSKAAQRYHDRFAEVVGELLASEQPSLSTVSFADFWLRAQSILFGEEDAVSDLATELRDRWEAVVLDGAAPNTRQVHLKSSDLREAMRASFPVTDEGWVMARHQCPDIMFCASSPEALMRGDYLAVLGEVHIGGNTLATNLFLSQHPEPQAMLTALADDLGTPYVCPKLSPEASSTPIRTQWIEDPAACTEILFSRALVPANPTTALNMADLTVGLGPHGRLFARHPGTGWSVPLLDTLGDFLFLRVLNHFGVTHKQRRTPRITIDRLVVQRERWIFDAEEVAAVIKEETDDEGFCAARRWARAQGLPNQIFVKLSWEDKPFFVDFRSPMLVRLLIRPTRLLARDGAASGHVVSITEMLPDAEQLWLRDPSGRTYTSELRLVCIHRDDVATVV
jgi:hypothetical protein